VGRAIHLVATLSIVLAIPFPAQATDNTVIIEAPDVQVRDGRSDAQSLEIRPKDESQKDLSRHIAIEPSFLERTSGQVANESVELPIIRGYNSGFTELYADGILINDPNLGIDAPMSWPLRAFGRVSFDLGSDPSIQQSSLSPIGRMCLYTARDPKHRGNIGIRAATGDTRGAHAVYDSASRTISDWHHRAFVDLASSEGNLAVYDDQGTPYNAYDDGMTVRRNNQSQSKQFGTMSRRVTEERDLRFLSRIADWKRSIPSRDLSSNDALSSSGSNVMAGVGLKQPSPIRPAHEGRMSFQMSGWGAKQTVKDPDATFLGLTDSLATHHESFAAKIGHSEQSQRVNAGVAIDYGQSRGAGVNANDEELTSLRREYVGVWMGHQRNWSTFETKVALALRRVYDKGLVRDWQQTSTLDREHSVGSAALTLAKTIDWFGLYSQWARFERAPTLLEEMGDGMAVVPAETDLQAEAVLHREIGVKTKLGLNTLSLAYYNDQIDHKIVFVPARLQALRAKNVRAANHRGVEVRTSGAWSWLEWQAGWAKQDSQQGVAGADKMLPMIPQDQLHVMLATKIGDRSKFRIYRRERGESYRDIENTVEVPRVVFWDATYDFDWPTEAGNLRSAFSVNNIFNETSADIATEDGSNRGRSALVDVDGEYLPSRVMQASVSWQW
jgi:hypothetical protein